MMIKQVAITDSGVITDSTVSFGKRRLGLAAGAACLALVAAGCGSSSHTASATTSTSTATTPTSSASTTSTTSTTAPSASTAAPVSVKLGYFPDITHAPALVGVEEGIFAKALAPDTLATPQVFSAGPDENTALLSGSIDLAFEGPSSALSAFTSSHGAVAIIAGVASGGAGLVVKKSITSVSQLKGTKLGTPELANTQDIALRYYLKQHGYTTTTTGGGDVEIEPSSTGSGTVVTEFRSGAVDGAWMPEPYEQELIADGGHVLTSETGATTDLVVRTAFLKAHPATVSRFLQGLLNSLSFMKAHKAEAETAANKQLSTLQGGASLPTSVLDAAWDNITFGDNPEASTLTTQVKDGEAVGLLTNPGNVSSIFDLTPLNDLLTKAGQPTVSGS